MRLSGWEPDEIRNLSVGILRLSPDGAYSHLTDLIAPRPQAD